MGPAHRRADSRRSARKNSGYTPWHLLPAAAREAKRKRPARTPAKTRRAPPAPDGGAGPPFEWERACDGGGVVLPGGGTGEIDAQFVGGREERHVRSASGRRRRGGQNTHAPGAAPAPYLGMWGMYLI